MTMTQPPVPIKTDPLAQHLQQLQALVHQAASQGTPIHETELLLWKQILTIGRQSLFQFLSLVGPGDLGPSLTLPDGQTCERLPELHTRRYVSIFGEFRIERIASGSREGQPIAFVPLDNRLQLPQSTFSYVLQDWDQSFCVEMSYAQASTALGRILGWQQSVGSLEAMTVHMAQQVASFRDNRPQPDPQAEGPLLVSSADGKGIVMRREEGDQVPAAHRTKGEKASQKRMAIVGAVYTVAPYVRTAAEVVAALFGDELEKPPQRPQPCAKRVWASLSLADERGQVCPGLERVYEWLLNEVVERDRELCKPRVHICDGQEALWEGCQSYLPQRKQTEVLDLLHVTPRLWQAAHLFHAEKSVAAAAFVRERLLRVLRGKAAGVIRGLREMGTKRGLSGAKKKSLGQICAYLGKNLGRMRDDEYLRAGYPIASGVIEGACRHLVKDRMERAGMHWRPEGAQAMLDVRSIYLNEDWEEYQAYRIRREKSQLYPWRELVEGPEFCLAA